MPLDLGPTGLRLILGDCRESLMTLPDESVHCIVTSPPYWRLRDYRVEAQLGMEALHDCLGWATLSQCGECFVCHMIEVFRSAWRVLRRDGTLWLNLSETYAAGGNGGGGAFAKTGIRTPQAGTDKNVTPAWRKGWRSAPNGLKPKDMAGISWRVALALQADGWYLRMDNIWSKTNPMPESVSDRPTRSHEYLFLLSKSEDYFYDAQAVREGENVGVRRANSQAALQLAGANPRHNNTLFHQDVVTIGHNKRSVWSLPTEACKEAHYATYPRALIRPCILAGTSAKGCCPLCGSPWERIISAPTGGSIGRNWNGNGAEEDLFRGHLLTVMAAKGGPLSDYRPPETLGWRPTCCCHHSEEDVLPCIVMDPFMGSGTTGLVARELGRGAVGVELHPENVEMARRRILGAVPPLNLD